MMAALILEQGGQCGVGGVGWMGCGFARLSMQPMLWVPILWEPIPWAIILWAAILQAPIIGHPLLGIYALDTDAIGTFSLNTHPLGIHAVAPTPWALVLQTFSPWTFTPWTSIFWATPLGTQRWSSMVGYPSLGHPPTPLNTHPFGHASLWHSSFGLHPLDPIHWALTSQPCRGHGELPWRTTAQGCSASSLSFTQKCFPVQGKGLAPHGTTQGSALACREAP